MKKLKYDFSQPISRKNSWKWESERFVDGHEVLPMSVADTDFISPIEVTDTLREMVEAGEFGYSAHPDDHCEVFAEWQYRHHDWEVNPGNVLITNGLLATMSAVIEAVSQPGDGVVLFTPVYHCFREAIEKNARQVLSCELLCNQDNYWSLDLDAYQGLCSRVTTKAVVICNPHNPVGRAWTEGEIESIVDIAQRNNMTVISDEIHGDYVFDKPFNPTLKCVRDKNAVVMLSSGGKTFNLGGLFGSYAVTEDANLKIIIRSSLSKQLWHQNRFTAWASYSAFKYGYQYRDELIAYVRTMQRKMVTALNEMPYPVKAVLPEATYLLWADFRETGWSADELQQFLVKSANLGFSRGDSFGANGAGFARINCGVPETTIDEAIKRLTTAFASLSAR